ncbi:MAG: carboxypeptidase-like regulatory domain-containing protein [Planctomycetota bacterium]|nr:carboxypeptidase-like regulatory domain-containing protein [Planctomycetota bacterium]
MKPTTILLALGALAALGIGALALLLGGDGSDRSEAVSRAARPGAVPSDGVVDELSAVAAAEADESQPERTAVPLASEERKQKRQAAAEEVPTGPFLRGVVIDEFGFPVPGADVVVSEPGGPDNLLELLAAVDRKRETTTKEGGTFEVSRGRWNDEVRVEVTARGFQILNETRTIETAEGDSHLGEFTPQLGVVLAGVVIDSEGRPVASADVWRTDIEGEQPFDSLRGLGFMGGDGVVETDDEGRFELAHEEPGQYALNVRHKDHQQGRFEGVTPPAGQELTGLKLLLAPTVIIRGVVQGFPVGKKHVVAQARVDEVSTNDDSPGMSIFFEAAGLGAARNGDVQPNGSFEIGGLEPGKRYRVRAFQKGGFFEQAPCSDEQTVPAGADGVILAWDGGAMVTFRVRDAGTEGRVSDVTLRYRWTEGGKNTFGNDTRKRTFPTGIVRLEELRPSPSPGKLELVVSAPGYLEHREASISVPAGGKVDLGVIKLMEAAIVRVQVLDQRNGKPVKNARVVLRPEHSEAEKEAPAFFENVANRTSSGKTDGEGWCELGALSSDKATLVVRRPNYARYEREGLAMPRGGTIEETVSLLKGGGVDVLVVDSTGLAARGATVHSRAPDGSRGSRETGRKGTVRLKNLVPGEHRFRASRQYGDGGVRVTMQSVAGEKKEVWLDVIVANGRTTSITLEVPSTASLRGTVTARGAPVPHAQVSFLTGAETSRAERMRSAWSERWGGGGTKAKTDTRGHFRIPEVPVGRHRLRITRADGALPYFVQVEIQNGENRVEIEVPTASIEGRIVDSNGGPVGGAKVRAVRVEKKKESESELEEIAAMTAFFGGSEGKSVTSRADGSFVIDGVPPGVPLVVEASARGFVANRSDELTLDEDDIERGVDIALTMGGSVQVEVVGDAGTFVFIGARFEGEADPKPEGKMAFARGGKVVLRDMAPGKWTVYLARRGGEEVGQSIEVRAGEESFVQLAP